MIGIIDYGAGNLYSVQKALNYLGLANTIIRAPNGLAGCDKLLLPGVGHFGSAMQSLQAAALLPALKDWLTSDRPFLGICLGMQLLFSASAEAPGVQGLDFFKGQVRAYTCRPHLQIGWNLVRANRQSVVWENESNEYFYYVNGYYVIPSDQEIVAGVSDYGCDFAAAVQCGRIWGVQFHPEKSATAGLELLRRWGTL
jgi:imidazole glycerol phosphate synthase glutamine amidotransferase subunit